MKKRLLLPFSLLCLAGMIVACGPQGNSSNQTSNPQPDSSEQPIYSGGNSSKSSENPGPSSGSQTPTPSSSEAPVNYQVSITNAANLAEEWFASDGNRTVALSCSPGVVRTLLGKEIFVASSDESIVKVENNQVLVPVAPGKVTITVIYHNAYASCKVTVKGMTRPATIEEVAKGVADGSITKDSKATELYGTVTGIYGNTAIIQEGDYAMYVYNKNYEGIKVGDQAHLISTYTLYNGLVETSTVSIFEKSTKAAEEIKAATIAAADFKDLKKEDASRLINVSGIYSLGESLSKGGCGPQATPSGVYRVSSVKIGDLETYIFVNKYLDETAMAAINAKLNEAEEECKKIEVKGGHVYVNTQYMDAMAISITSADQLVLTDSDIVTLPTKVELSADKDKISIADKVQLSAKFTPSNTNRKALSYASSNENVAKVDKNGVVTGVGLGKATITATSTAVANVSATFNVTVVEPEFALSLEDGGQYYLGMNHEGLGKKIFLTGAMDKASPTYGATVEGKENGLLYTAEKTDNAGEFYLKGSDGNYLGIVKPEGKTFYTLNFSETPLAWSVDAASYGLKATYDGAVRFMGTSNSRTYNTIGVIKENQVASNFIIRAYDKNYVPAPEEQKPYLLKLSEGDRVVLGLEHTNVNKNIFMTGLMDEKSPTYGATAEYRGNGLAYTAEKAEADGQFYLKGDDGKYLSLVKPEGKTFYTVDFTAEKKVAWSLDEENNALCATYDNELRMLGTSNSKSYTTIGVIKASAAASNFLVRAYPEFDNALVANGKYVIGLYQAGAKKNIFMTGAMDEKSPTYGATVEGKANGLVYTAEPAAEEGQFYLKGSDGKYLSIVKPEGKTFYTVDFTAEKKVAWSLDEATGALCATYDNELRMMGTSNSKTYTTIGIVKASAAASNFLVRAYLVGVAEAAAPADTKSVSVTTKDLLEARGYTKSANNAVVNYKNIGLDKAEGADITISTTGTGNCGSFWGDTCEYRLYQNKDGNLTVKAKDGLTIVSVKITFGVSNTGSLLNGTTAVASNSVVNVNANSITFTVGNSGTATNGQVKITAIEVIYK